MISFANKFSILFVILSLPLWALAVDTKLDLSSLSTETQQAILKQYPRLKSNEIKKSDLDQLIRYLVTQEQFDSAQVIADEQADATTYRVNVGKTRRISKLTFKGMDHISESIIRREFSIGEKALFDQQSLIEAGERIRRMYRDRGFQNTVIDLEFERKSAVDVEVTIKIKEGPQTIIVNIDVKATNPRLKEQIQRLLNKELKGEALTDSSIAQAKNEVRESLSKKRYYKAALEGPSISLNSDESEARLDFSISDSDEYFIEFEGAKAKTASSLESDLELNKFFSSNPQIGPELASKVKNIYLEDGYSRVEVSSEQVNGLASHSQKVVIKIDEGPRVKIQEIRFNGHFRESEEFYSDFIKGHSTKLISKGYYHREALDLGLKNLMIDRQNNGYLKAKIVSTKVSYQGDKKDKIIITINLEEGPLTQLESLKFDGNVTIGDRALQEVVGLKAGEPLRLNQLEEGINKLKDYYHSLGYLEMYIVNEKQDLVHYNEDSTKAEVHFLIYQGPQIVVSSILVEGNSITKDSVVLKEIEFEVGDILTPQKIEESVARLQRLGHFATVDIRMLEEKTQIAQRTIIIRVQDKDPGVFELGMGANNERQLTLRGYAGIAYRNIMGSGHGISLRLEGNYNIADIKYLERKVVVGYLWPYLFNTRIKGRATYTQSTFVSDSDKKEATEVKQIVYSVEQNLTSHVLLSYDLWNSAFLRKFAIYPDQNSFPTTELGIVTTGPTLDIDFRDHPFNPTKGTRTILSMEYASPALGSDDKIEYSRYYGNFTHYTPLGNGGWVFANSLRGGYLRNLSNKDGGGVPYDVRGLSLGGQSTIRGFTLGEVFPGEIELGVKPTDYKLTKSASMYLFKSELRFPIYKAFGGAFFYDGGAVFIQDLGFEDPYRDAVGIALRYETPVGAASMEVGYKLDRKNDDRPGRRREDAAAFHLSIGTF